MAEKILIVGGCGFIGHNLALKLKLSGYEPVVLDSLSINNLHSEDGEEFHNPELYKSILKERIKLLDKNDIELIIQDARDYHATSKIYSKINPQIIVHLAAVSHANKSNKNPHTTFDHSLRTLENTLDFARSSKTHVVYLSSSMVYGQFNNKKVDENTLCNPIGIYGNLKFAGELMVKSYGQVFELPYTIIRPSALYGERCVSRRVGQVFIESALENKEIIINGSGKDKLDFTYIEDLLSGIELICQKKDKSKNQIFNITYGYARQINDLLDIIKKEFPKIKVVYKDREKFSPERGTLDITKAKKLLGYQSKYPIEDGYLKYISWYKSYFNKL